MGRLFMLAALLSADGGADHDLVLEVGQSIVLKVPKLQRCAVSSVSVYQALSIGNDQLRVTGLAEGRTTLLCWSSDDQRWAWRLDVRERAPRRAGTAFTELFVGEEAFIAASGVQSAASDDRAVVRAAVQDGGVSVTALAPGKTDVRVRTKAGPIVHQFEVRR